MKSSLFFSPLFLLGLSSIALAQTPINEVFEPAAPADLSKFGMVAVVQWNVSAPTPVGADVTPAQAEAYKQAARETLAGYVRTAAAHGAKLVITPEFGLVNYPDIPDLPSEDDDFRNRADIAPYVEKVPGPSSDYFGKLAKELGIYIHIGYAEVDPVTDQYFNVVVALGPKGDVVAKYHKINLYQLENDFLSPGTTPGIYKNKFFGNIGFAICADIGASNPMSTYAAKKVDAVALSTSWAAMDSGMSAFRGAASRANTYVLAANNMYFPDSGVINPDGTNQSWIRQTQGIAYGYLPLKTSPNNDGKNQ